MKEVQWQMKETSFAEIDAGFLNAERIRRPKYHARYRRALLAIHKLARQPNERP